MPKKKNPSCVEHAMPSLRFPEPYIGCAGAAGSVRAVRRLVKAKDGTRKVRYEKLGGSAP